jgi:hypothetical protein
VVVQVAAACFGAPWSCDWREHRQPATAAMKQAKSQSLGAPMEVESVGLVMSDLLIAHGAPRQ